MVRTGRILLGLIAISVALVVATALPAGAHATLVEATPADGARVATSPSTVILHFSESVTITGDSVRVVGTDGKRVDDGRPKANGADVSIGLESALRPDTYVVAWRVVSADDHPVHGATTFLVGDATRASDATIAGVLGSNDDGPWTAIGVVARGLSYAGGLVLVGIAAWMVVVDRGPLRRPVRNLAFGAAAVGAFGSLLTVPVQAATSTGLGLRGATDLSILSDVLQTPLGWGLLLLAAGFGALVAVFSRRQPTPLSSAATADASGWGVTRSVAVAGALLIAVGFARSGHTETTDPRALIFSADVVHVLAAGAWVGGAALLASELWSARRGRLSPVVTADHVDRFSRLAAGASLVAGAAGVTLAWGTVRHLDALTSTTYGRTLLVKVLLVVAVGAVAAYNHYSLVPAVRDEAAEGPDAEPRARRLLLRTVGVELVGLLAVVGLTAALVNTEPARVASSSGVFERTVAFGNGSAVIQVDPAKAGDNAVHVYLLDDVGRQLELIDTPTFSFTLSSRDIGPIDRTPWRAGPGHYTYEGLEMSMRGTWTIDITGRTSTFDESTATVQVPIR